MDSPRAPRPLPSEPELDLARRAVFLPLILPSPSLRRRVTAVARSLHQGDRKAAEAQVDALEGLPPQLTAGWEQADGSCRSPGLRAQALGRLLLDLHQAGWEVCLEGSELFVVAPLDSRTLAARGARSEAKARVRAATVAAVRAQLTQPQEQHLVRELEARGVDRLLSHPSAVLAALEDRGPGAVQPYLQQADGGAGIDHTTGLPLYSVFRYFRFLWSFPYGDTPGRTLPFLIRDAGQPGDPVCGLLCLSSPVLQLTARDAHLGFSPHWAQAAARSVLIDLPDDQGDALELLAMTWSDVVATLDAAHAVSDHGLQGRVFLGDLAALLGLGVHERPRTLARVLLRTGVEPARAALQRAQARLAHDIVRLVEGAVKEIDDAGLSVSGQAVIAAPGASVEPLMAQVQAAREARRTALAQRSEAAAAEDVQAARGHKAEADGYLFERKRAGELARLARAWEDLGPLRRAHSSGSPGVLRRVLADAVLGGEEHLRERAWLSPERCSRGVRTAIRMRKIQTIASQVVDVSLCGAVPPYGALLGGKLAALLALSRDVARTYFDTYEERTAEIQSRVSGAQVTRSSRLVALTTSSFFGVGSAQYSRVRLPKGVGWLEVGRSRGYGTLHFSRSTTQLFARLLEVERGVREVNSTFGEGTSERLRKIRMALEHLGLPADELLRHGEGRILYVADLARTGPPGMPVGGVSHHEEGPTAAEVVEFWRERWLGPRLRSGLVRRDLGHAGADDALVSVVHAPAFQQGEE